MINLYKILGLERETDRQRLKDRQTEKQSKEEKSTVLVLHHIGWRLD